MADSGQLSDTISNLLDLISGFVLTVKIAGAFSSHRITAANYFSIFQVGRVKTLY
jgi:hypothetical protein